MKAHISQLTSHSSQLIAHSSQLIAHISSLIAHISSLTAHSSQLTTSGTKIYILFENATNAGDFLHSYFSAELALSLFKLIFVHKFF